MTTDASILKQRRAGILLHPTSLPGAADGGALGDGASRFVDFLDAAGQSVWQTLPLGSTHDDGSPYLCLSVHAGNPDLISMTTPELRRWSGDSSVDTRAGMMEAVWRGFGKHAAPDEQDAAEEFYAGHDNWLDDYALYMVIREQQNHRAWIDWPAPLRDRDPDALDAVRRYMRENIARYRFWQFVFYRQWQDLKRYANRRGVRMFGDLPIFVAHDSADVWAHREYFLVDSQGDVRAVAGVPPDYFSATGQRWGNPHYDWERMQADGFRWWLERFDSQLDLFDLVRIDHFRGFEAYWSIDAEQPDAVHGEWIRAPGAALFDALHQRFGELPLVAEDLGYITPEVTALRRRFALPGMKVIQFAFDGNPANPYLPHNIETDAVVYTGTHDNDTALGWYSGLDEQTRQRIDDYLGYSKESMPWPLIRAALASVACLAMLPMQDALGLGSEHRMNRPGTTQGNWNWRFAWEDISEGLAVRLRHLTALYGRIPE